MKQSLGAVGFNDYINEVVEEGASIASDIDVFGKFG
jgi:hypothetical protein